MPFTCTLCTYFTTEKFEEMLKHKRTYHSENDDVTKPVIDKRRSGGIVSGHKHSFGSGPEVEKISNYERKNKSFEDQQVVGKVTHYNSPVTQVSSNKFVIKNSGATKMESLQKASHDDSAFFSSPDHSPNSTNVKTVIQNPCAEIDPVDILTPTMNQTVIVQQADSRSPATGFMIKQRPSAIGTSKREEHVTTNAKKRPATLSTTTGFKIKQIVDLEPEASSTPIARKRPVTTSTPTTEEQRSAGFKKRPVVSSTPTTEEEPRAGFKKRPVAFSTPTTGNKLKESPVVKANRLSSTENEVPFFLGSYIKNVYKPKPKNYKKIAVDQRIVATGCSFCKNAAAAGDGCLPPEEIVVVHERVRGCLRVHKKSRKYNIDCPICIFITDNRKSDVPKNQKQIHEEMTW
jgi:hypothetical protein